MGKIMKLNSILNAFFSNNIDPLISDDLNMECEIKVAKNLQVFL